MFDQLHDPNPPAATSRHLAAVAERAAGMRRRRTATASGLTAVAVVAAGSLAVAVADRTDGGDVQVAGDALPQATSTEAPVDDVAPTTTVLDPSSLPPAVPVNPDPSDLPPAVPAEPDPDDGGVALDDDNSAVDDVQQPSGDDAPSDDAAETPADSTDDTPADDQADVATSATSRSSSPIAAITTSDTAVWFPSLDADPVELASGGGLERIDFLADGSATIETRRDGGLLSTLTPDGDEGPSRSIGVAHAVGPDGQTACGLDGGDLSIVCGRLDDDATAWPFDRAEVVGRDLTWLDGDTVLVIGEWESAWSLSIVDVSTGAVTSRPFALRSEFADLRFAGVDGVGRVAIHDAGTDRVLLGELERFGGWDPEGAEAPGTALEVRTYDAPMRSIWLDGSAEILVTADGTLSVDGTDVPGSYVAARA